LLAILLLWAGENVDALFTRVAAVVFERMMEAESSSEQQEKQATIGPSNTLISESTYQNSKCLVYNFKKGN